jgi:tetratricopeptide (TPR) repeat protein
MAEEAKTDEMVSTEKNVPFVGPNAARKKRIVELLHGFLQDKVSLAELRGISKEKLFLLAEAGYIKFKHGRVEEAEKIYQALIVLDHRNGYYHSVMGAIHQKKDRPVEAILEYSRAIQIDSADLSCYVNRGEIYLRHRNYRKAAEDFRQAIVMDKSGRDMWANRSRSLVIALKRSLEAQRKKKPLKPRIAKRATPVDAAARDSQSVPKAGTPTPPTPKRATPQPRKKVPRVKKTTKK